MRGWLPVFLGVVLGGWGTLAIMHGRITSPGHHLGSGVIGFPAFSAGNTSKGLEKSPRTYQLRFRGPVQDSACVIAYYFGRMRLVYDTIPLKKKGKWHICTIQSDTVIPTGIYIAYLPKTPVYLEFVISAAEKKFRLDVQVDTSQTRFHRVKVKGSEENRVFYQFNYEAFRLRRDSVEGADSLIRVYARTLIQKHPDLFFTRVLGLMYAPEVPDTIQDDSLRWRYLYDWFLANLPVGDEAMLRTPILHDKVMFFLDRVVPPVPDTLCQVVSVLIRRSWGARLAFRYWVSTLLNHYAASRIMGMDAVYVCIVDSYYARGLTPWLDSTTLQRIVFEASLLKFTLIGKRAPEIFLPDTAGRYYSLYQVQAPYTILVFWDPDCGHCRRALPVLAKVYKHYREYGVKVFAVNVGTDSAHWVQFLHKHDLGDWIQVADLSGTDPVRYYYYIRGTPYIFLLDSNKTILAKQLSVEQVNELLSRRLGVEPAPLKGRGSESSHGRSGGSSGRGSVSDESGGSVPTRRQ